MIRFFCGCFLFWGAQIFAQAESYPADYSEFFEQFVAEQQEIIDLTYPGSSSSPCGPLTSKPTIPALAQASPDLAHIPIVLVNDTGLPDDQVYFTVYGKSVDGAPSMCQTNTKFAFVSFPTPVGVFVAPPTAPPADTSQYSYKFSEIPLSSGQRTIYVPYINAGIILFSIGPLSVHTDLDSIAVPVPTDPNDPSYATVYGSMEISFFPPDCSPALNQLTIDFSCVDFYGLSIYMNLHTNSPAPGLPVDRPSGIYQSRHYTLCNLKRTLASASSAARSQWESLIIKSGSKILRVASPGYAMSHAGGTFDPNYFDNAAAYGFSWRDDVWNGPFYTSNNLTLTTTDGTGYTGNTTGSAPNKVFTFTATSGPGQAMNEVVQIPWSNMSSPSTSTALFNVAEFFPGMQYSSDGGMSYCTTGIGCPSTGPAIARLTEITKHLSSAIAAGLIPGKVASLPAAGFSQGVINTYYSTNQNLVASGPSTGPWYDLYSLGLLSNTAVTGNVVYTYPYDDYLYPSLEVAPSQDTIDATTYITVVLGPYSDN